MRTGSPPREPEALQVDDVGLTCNRPLSLTVTHGPICGKAAVAKLPIGISGQLTTMLLCPKHLAELVARLPDCLARLEYI